MELKRFEFAPASFECRRRVIRKQARILLRKFTRDGQKNPGAIKFALRFIHSASFVNCELTTAITRTYYAVRVVARIVL